MKGGRCPHPIDVTLMKGGLAKQSIDFSIRIVTNYEWLIRQKHEYVMSRQILRSGTRIGANIHESEFAASTADFKNKLRIAAKEAGETDYWLIVLERTGYYIPEFNDLKPRVESLLRMLTATLKKLDDDNAKDDKE